MNTGIYQIVNFTNSKRYIGSALNLRNRKSIHFRCMKKNKHPNKYLQNAFNKYGVENFKFEILLYCSKEDLILYEQRAIDAYNIKNELYNISPTAGSCLGIKHSEETKKKMSKASLGKKKSEEHRQNISLSLKGKKNYMYGKPYPEERKILQSKKLKGKKRNPEHVIKIANSQRGKKRPQVSKEKNGSYKKVDDELIIKLVKKGKTNIQINKITGIPIRIILTRLKWYGLTSNRTNEKIDIDIELVQKYRLQGLFYYEIAKILNVSESIISKNYRKSKYYKKDK